MFLEWLYSSGLNQNLVEAVGQLYQSTVLTESEQAFPKEYIPSDIYQSVKDHFIAAIKEGQIDAHATNFENRYNGFDRYIDGHKSAMGCLDAVKNGRARIYPAYYQRTNSGRAKYVAYASADGKTLIKFVSSASPFPLPENYRFRIYTCYPESNPRVISKWLQKITGRRTEQTTEPHSEPKPRNPIYEVSSIIEEQMNQAMPLATEIYQLVNAEADPIDYAKIYSLSCQLQPIADKLNRLYSTYRRMLVKKCDVEFDPKQLLFVERPQPKCEESVIQFVRRVRTFNQRMANALAVLSSDTASPDERQTATQYIRCARPSWYKAYIQLLMSKEVTDKVLSEMGSPFSERL
jgi:hypothetical protein